MVLDSYAAYERGDECVTGEGLLLFGVRLDITAVDAEQCSALRFGQSTVVPNSILGRFVVQRFGAADQARMLEQRLRGDVQRVCDRPEHPDGWLVQPALHLAQGRIGDLGQRGQLSERQI